MNLILSLVGSLAVVMAIVDIFIINKNIRFMELVQGYFLILSLQQLRLPALLPVLYKI